MRGCGAGKMARRSGFCVRSRAVSSILVCSWIMLLIHLHSGLPRVPTNVLDQPR